MKGFSRSNTTVEADKTRVKSQLVVPSQSSTTNAIPSTATDASGSKIPPNGPKTAWKKLSAPPPPPPPAFCSRKIGRGNYLVLYDPAVDKSDRKRHPERWEHLQPIPSSQVATGGEKVIRYDGVPPQELVESKEVPVQDSRLELPEEKRLMGYGQRKQRDDGLVPIPKYVSLEP